MFVCIVYSVRPLFQEQKNWHDQNQMTFLSTIFFIIHYSLENPKDLNSIYENHDLFWHASLMQSFFTEKNCIISFLNIGISALVHFTDVSSDTRKDSLVACIPKQHSFLMFHKSDLFSFLDTCCIFFCNFSVISTWCFTWKKPERKSFNAETLHIWPNVGKVKTPLIRVNVFSFFEKCSILKLFPCKLLQ